jgi:hypothetical protein
MYTKTSGKKNSTSYKPLPFSCTTPVGDELGGREPLQFMKEVGILEEKVAGGRIPTQHHCQHLHLFS